MHTIELHIGTGRRRRLHRFSGPSCWAELTTAQVLAVMRVRAMGQTSALFPLLKLLYGIKYRHQRWLFNDSWLRRQGVGEDDRTQILELGVALLDTLSFLNDADPVATFYAHGFRRYDAHFGNPLVLCRRLLHRTRYFGPSAAMGNSSFAEFIAADMAYRAKNWPLLVATLYRPAQANPTQEDTRIPFDGYESAARAKLFADLDPALLATVRHSFESTLIYLQSCFLYVFPRTPATPKSGEPLGNWLDVALAMAQLDVTKMTSIEQANVYLALKSLNTRIRQAEDMEQQLEKARKK